ncbi:MAG: VOC family protein [Acidimicrobiaceae bacterium]|nr:VOC family protein [Acidimicrobiaceae bacterium]
MIEYGGQRYPTICPYVYYEDGLAALEWLTKAFGFRERFRTVDNEGRVGHCEMELGDGLIMMGSPPDHKSPAQLGQVTVGIYVHVDDVDAHYERAVNAGAEVQGPPADQPYGVRSYGALDCEGHQWWFSQPLAV